MPASKMGWPQSQLGGLQSSSDPARGPKFLLREPQIQLKGHQSQLESLLRGLEGEGDQKRKPKLDKISIWGSKSHRPYRGVAQNKALREAQTGLGRLLRRLVGHKKNRVGFW